MPHSYSVVPSIFGREPWKLVLLLLIIGLVCLVLLEIGVRAVFAVKVGQDVLLYGLVPNRQELNVGIHANIVEGRYSKYFPDQIRIDRDMDTGETFQVITNQYGFRGANFTLQKAPGVTRVVTLGASSTFGYRARDNDTYPFVLEGLLNQGCDQREFEVINLGIPHLDSPQILALFLEEALPLNPDIVTFYEGVNDSAGGTWRAPHAPSLRDRLHRFVRQHVLLAQLLHDLTHRELPSTAADVQAEIEQRTNVFLFNLQRILDESRTREISFVVATQQAKSSMFDRKEIRGTTYAEEVTWIRSRLAQDGAVAGLEKILLIHSRLMESLRRWAKENKVPLVDVILALDKRRDMLLSWVHLSPEGNRIVARAFADRILSMTCA